MIMRKVYNSKDNAKGQCYEACIASLLNMPLDQIPLYKMPDHWIKMDKWLYEQGFVSLLIENKPGLDFQCNFPYIVALRLSLPYKPVAYHACIYQTGKLIHDPSGIMAWPGAVIQRVISYQVLLPMNPVCRCDFLDKFHLSANSNSGYSILETYKGEKC
jgi:hypothetical protein